MKTITLLFLSLFIANSCNNTQKKDATTSTFFVNSAKVPCEGVAPMNCLQIQKGDTLEGANWEFFYNTIEGFTYEPGYIYKVKVKETALDPATVPADASTVKYTLVEILEKKEDATLQLHDIWALETVHGTAVNKENFPKLSKQPVLELLITERRIAGNDGCNTIFGSIEDLDAEKIRFGKMGSTRMACLDMEIPSSFTAALLKTTSYKKEGLQLAFYNEENVKILNFKKVD